MRYKLVALALTALVVVGAGGAMAAGSAQDSPADGTAQTNSDLPDKSTTEVIDPNDTLETEQVDAAVEAAWANDDVRSYVEDGEAVHLEVWDGMPDDDTVFVDVASADAPNETRVTARVDIDRGTVTDLSEPVTLDQSNGMSVERTDDGEFVVGNGTDRLVTEQSADAVDGSVAFDVDGNDDADTVSIETGSNNQTVASEDGTVTLTLTE
ncbi:hypothetical protein [Natrinema salaciae]|uniref:Uncharacterized protein n=1 Tax=Natrinema salaciae TaxID=1186196 RepID=A0A1H9LE92_9EURY|nr:hypothetical protein [Natrinema salaciae]SER09746.1 hypothetical protein SAMN04489841_2941 [Natrinema salaciae]